MVKKDIFGYNPNEIDAIIQQSIIAGKELAKKDGNLIPFDSHIIENGNTPNIDAFIKRLKSNALTSNDLNLMRQVNG
ncbi:MAG: hypothetical protein GXO40_00440 [Epsilonproteobacteria bacterium]|nr:hypothetical protein [Campylobacterota bacterium]